ncbi:mandelate racemase/muconate lactonizing enzyme family protein [Roseobacter sp. HKCCA0882]|uniref:mandelate racemase/muconate lactonizing enzyme family protein n=1 Tax=Roseobacter sp. HKCCA0882 TaxID=3120337 RepID=UPI0030EB3B31
MAKIVSVLPRLFRLPLAEVLSDAKHGDHTHFELITATVKLDDGSEGTGYSYTGGWGGHAIKAMIEHDLTPFLIGKDATQIEQLHDQMRWHIHYVGRGGVSAFAIAAVDVALWDIRGKRSNLSLCEMAGGVSRTCKAYVGGIDLNFPLEKLLSNMDQAIQSGFNGVKIKIGRENLEEDIERIYAVRERIGSDTTFMVDANYGMSVDQAISAIRQFENANITWFEEPIDPDDLNGYRIISEQTGFPLAIGENCHSIHDFELLEKTKAFKFFQPDVATCGGITTWLRAAAFAERNGISVCTHGMQELHVSLLCGRENAGWLEVHAFPIDTYTHQPLKLNQEHMAVAPQLPGIGVTFDWDKLEAENSLVS